MSRKPSVIRPLAFLIIACAIVYGLALCSMWPRVAHAQMGGGAIYCNQHVTLVGFTTKATLIPAAAAGSAQIYVCGYTVASAGTSVVTFQAGTGAACVTTSAAIGPTINLFVAATSTFADTSPAFRGFLVPSVITAGVSTPQALCVTATTTAATIDIYYSYGN